MYRQAKDKSKEKTCIQGGKQPVRKKKNRQEKQSLKGETLRSLS